LCPEQVGANSVPLPFLPILPFSTFLAVSRPLPLPSPLFLSLNRLIQRFLFCPSFYIKPSPLFILLLVTSLSSRASYVCCERFLFAAESLPFRLLKKSLET